MISATRIGILAFHVCVQEGIVSSPVHSRNLCHKLYIRINTIQWFYNIRNDSLLK
jgi:hypothetical protein